MMQFLRRFLASLPRAPATRAAPPEAAPTTRQLVDSFAVGGDVPCKDCGYNLRGLTSDRMAKCPECGKSVVPSILYHLSARTGFPLDVFIFFEDAVRWYMALRTPPLEQIDERQLCVAVRDYALEEAGHPEGGMELLQDWGIRRSEEIGTVFCSMIEIGLLKASVYHPDDFDGLFDLRALFASAT